jgi:nucleotide-binding universal stress UspA family protein
LVTGSIICGVDGSESARCAARVARGLSSELGLRLLFVRVVDERSLDERMDATAERLERLRASTTDVDCGAGWLVDVGHPADRLVAAAAAEEARFIVVGSTGPHSSLRNSVPAEVARRALCPVVVVPPGAAWSANGDGNKDEGDAIARLGIGSDNGRAQSTSDPEARDFAGGIVRFSLGGYRDGGYER